MLIVFGTFCGLASGDTVTTGGTDQGNVFPFGSPNYVGEYQQVYSASLFSGPVDITAIAFFPQTDNPGQTISGDFTLDLSTTSAGIDGLSTTYADNIGTNNALFFSGSVSDVLSFTGTPFLYNPSQGNLLLDVNVVTPNSATNAFAAGCSPGTDRVFNSGGNGSPTVGGEGCSAGSGYGLETELTFTPASTSSVPEPSSVLLLSMGLLALIGATRFRRLDRQN
jgi:hypothetical protein